MDDDYIKRSEALRVIGEYDCRDFSVENVKSITDECKKAVSALPAAEVVPMDFHERCLMLEIHRRIEAERKLKELLSLKESGTLSAGGT